jgi:hypothetical protein
VIRSAAPAAPERGVGAIGGSRRGRDMVAGRTHPAIPVSVDAGRYRGLRHHAKSVSPFYSPHLHHLTQ